MTRIGNNKVAIADILAFCADLLSFSVAVAPDSGSGFFSGSVLGISTVDAVGSGSALAENKVHVYQLLIVLV
jgi:hypothetical protein